jgi:hypothetical protein
MKKIAIFVILVFTLIITIINLPSVKNYSKCKKYNELFDLTIQSRIKRAFEDSKNHNAYTIEFENGKVIILSPFVENSYELVSALKKGDLLIKKSGSLSFLITQRKMQIKKQLFFVITCED